jgi:hypothetical protein
MEMTMPRQAHRTLVAAFCLLSPSLAQAHEFIAKPATMTAAAGSPLPVAGLSSHVFTISQELEEAKDVKLGVFVDGRRSDIPLTANEKTLAYEGTATAPSAGTFIVTSLRLPQIWATMPEGTKPATKKTPGATNVRKIEEFCRQS